MDIASNNLRNKSLHFLPYFANCCERLWILKVCNCCTAVAFYFSVGLNQMKLNQQCNGAKMSLVRWRNRNKPQIKLLHDGMNLKFKCDNRAELKFIYFALSLRFCSLALSFKNQKFMVMTHTNVHKLPISECSALDIFWHLFAALLILFHLARYTYNKLGFVRILFSKVN